MRGQRSLRGRLVILGFLICCPGCVTSDVYLEPDMDFLALLPEVGGYTTEGDSLYLEDDSRQVVAELVAY